VREHERRQLLCRQSGCFCPPEEQTVTDWEYCDKHSGFYTQGSERCLVCAVAAAEREACWQEVLVLSRQELSDYDSAVASVDEYQRHINRHAAFTDAILSIRARGESE
jgi:hypothetical protein